MPRSQKSKSSQLTIAQQDYLETTLQLESRLGIGNVRITDIARELGTRLPTVSRTVAKLTELGLLDHKSRGRVSLTERGNIVAHEITHRHRDLVDFFTLALGLPREIAEQDTCQIEHGLSPTTAQRLHEFMEYFHQLGPEEKTLFTRFNKNAVGINREFANLPETRAAGWRK